VNVLVDSDVLIEVSRARDVALLEKWSQLSGSHHTILYSPVTSAELWWGVRQHEQPALIALFRGMKCVPADETTGRFAGDFLRRYAGSHGMKIGDALIAAAAAQHRAALWTHNRKHFPMLEIDFF
jgi:predicted nucleic acid-binding protein